MKKSLVLIVFGLLITPAGAQGLNKCDNGSPAQIRACLMQNIKTAQKAVEKKIADICKKQVSAGADGGSAKANDILACRADRMAKIVEGIN
jgi:hypothetical protein